MIKIFSLNSTRGGAAVWLLDIVSDKGTLLLVLCSKRQKYHSVL